MNWLNFLYHDLYEKLEAYGIHKIEKDKVILKPYLLKNKHLQMAVRTNCISFIQKWNLVLHS